MTFRSATLLLVACGLLTGARTVTAADETAAPNYERDVVPFLKKHCVDCHGPDSQEGNLRLDDLPPAMTNVDAAGHWIEVMDQLNLGQMPPEYQPRPDPHNTRRVAAWIAAELRAAERAAVSGGGRVVLRRMTRFEYANTVRDLLGVRFYPGEGPMEVLPPDGTAEGFDTVSAALTLDPSLLDRYFQVGESVAKKAIVDGPPEFPTKRLRLSFRGDSQSRYIRELIDWPGTEVGENAIGIRSKSDFHMRSDLRYPGRGTIATKGDYTIRLRAWVDPQGRKGPFRLRLHQRHPKAHLAFTKDFTLTEEPQVHEITVPRDPGGGHWILTFLDGTGAISGNQVYGLIGAASGKFGKEGDFRNVLRVEARRALEAGSNKVTPSPAFAEPETLPTAWVDYLEVEGPLIDQWPPAGHQFLFSEGENVAEDADYARRMFLRLLPKAFRRPIEPEEVEPYVAFVEQEMAEGRDFKAALRQAIAAMLTAPSFVFLAEPNPNERPRPLNDYELASRLSYFLWSSMPDDALFTAAEAGKLTADPGELERQVDRMLADDRVDGFVGSFAAQWLKTAEFRTFTPNEYLFPEYDERLGDAMVEEPLAFFRETLREDEDVLAFVDSDWTMLNERLAKHYGVKGVTGDEFRRVRLPSDSRRGGLLSMAGVAMRGSDGQRTKPVNRAVYVREVLFNDPPDPPPPNAGEVEPNIKGERLSVRDRLMQHQQIAACASCHRTLDPYGLALENFNVVGQWRENEDGQDFFRRSDPPSIDASGTLPNGESFETFKQFKALLAEQDERLCRGLSEKIMIYALGRSLTPTDRGTLDAMTNRMLSEDRTIRAALKSFVTSRQFLQK